MLKWLVTKGPSSSNPLEKVITDDPLATLTRKNKKYDPIYAVSRVNPIFEEDDKDPNANDVPNATEAEPQDEQPETPPTDRESVRSSGYGSKEADSVSFKSSDSQEDEEEPFFDDNSRVVSMSQPKIFGQRQRGKTAGLTDLNIMRANTKGPEIESSPSFGSPGTVAELRKSFEIISNQETKSTNQVEILQLNSSFVGSIEIGSHRPPLSTLEVIPEASESAENSPSKPAWPRVSHLAQTLQRQADRIHQRRDKEKLKAAQSDYTKSQVLRFNPLVSVVAQNEFYVTAISVSPNDQINVDANQYSNFSLNIKAEKPVPDYFRQRQSSSKVEFPLLSLQPDSLVNEDTIRMMKYPDLDMTSQTDVELINRTISREMPNFGRAIYSNFYQTHRSGSSSTSSRSGARLDNRGALYTVRANSGKKKGLSVVKDLWEKTGLKTNGRKLLVDVNDLIADHDDTASVFHKSYGSTDDYRSVNSIERLDSSQSRQVSNDANRTWRRYEYNSPVSHRTSSSNSYDELYERGIDNPSFTDDRGQARDSASIHSRSSFQFQHNLTDFQKRVGEKFQSGESSHRKSWLDVESGRSVSNNSSLSESVPGMSYNTNGILLVIKKKLGAKSNDKKNMPGKAVREFGLEDDHYKNHPWNSVNESQTNQNFGYHNHKLFWKNSHGNSCDRSLSGIFSLHPNSEAPICGDSSGLCQDFTIDPRRNQRNMLKSNQNKRQKRCCSMLVVIFALAFFVGTIIGVSWFYTGGERIFGPM